MGRELFWRYWADFSALYPGAVLCFAPVLEFLRKPRRTIPIMGRAPDLRSTQFGARLTQT